ncbi:MAG: restriction endonuclease [Clostridia bacterium]|nr:restriction endonuclease [Clostridia bacterium]
MFIPTKDHFCDMSPKEFEEFSLKVLNEHVQGLENLKFEHNKMIEKKDGRYQIDGKIEFTVMGVKYVTLVECKHYKSPISREKVQVLYDKIRVIGANKGILISTSNFQLGAIKYAREHGIALIQLFEEGLTYETRSLDDISKQGSFISKIDNSYIGILQVDYEDRIHCIHLRNTSNELRNFLLSSI